MRKIEFRGVVIDLGINDMELHVNVNDESVGIIIDLYQNKDGDPVYQEWSSVIDIYDLTLPDLTRTWHPKEESE